LALAATFWLTVATARLMIHGVPCAASAERFATPSTDDGDRLSPAEVDAVLETLRTWIEACEDHVSTGRVTVDLVINPTGTVQSANHSGEIAGTRPAYCVTDMLLLLRFRPSISGYDGSHGFQLR
jgi:hypothetical protein